MRFSSSFLPARHLTWVAVLLNVSLQPCQATPFITWDDFAVPAGVHPPGTLVVSLDGKGDSRTVQGAVDMVPNGNSERVKIIIMPGTYRERVVVPKEKPFVSFIGGGTGASTITWNSTASQSGSTYESFSVAIEAEYFCACNITFENSAPAPLPGAIGQQGVALRLSANYTMLYRCSILGNQDTLYDKKGKHYILECDIQGTVDFICGVGQSLYQRCNLLSVATRFGAVAASERAADDAAGFSFLDCNVTGSGTIYLGRAWGDYSRTVYAYSYLSSIVRPEGWSDMGHGNASKLATFGEYNCKGPGANTKDRVPWSHALTDDEARPFLNRSFIDSEQWLRL